MRKLFVFIIIGFAFLQTVSALEEKEVITSDSAVTNTEFNKISETRTFPKFRIGGNFGFSSPYNGLEVASWVGKSMVASAEYSLKKQSYLFSELIYSGYEALEGEVADKVYGSDPQPSGLEITSKSKTPCRVFSYVIGYGLRSNADYTKFAWRVGLGAIYNSNTEDEFKLKSGSETKTLRDNHSSSLGLDLMFGFELPLMPYNLGFFSTFNISSGIIGTKSGLGMQYTSMGLLGIYYRF